MYVGLAGVVPYLATSLSTVYLSFDIQYAANHGKGFLMSGEVAEELLHLLEPLQLGYGASVCISPPIHSYSNSSTRSFLSLVPFIGALNGPATVVNKATHVMLLVSLRQLLLGLRSSSLLRSA